jgi:hypothetical protein
MEVYLVIGQRAQLIRRHSEKVCPVRLQPIAALHPLELHQPFPVILPASLDREWTRHDVAGQVYHPDLPSRGEDAGGIVGEWEEVTVALQPVGFAKPANHHIRGVAGHQSPDNR